MPAYLTKWCPQCRGFGAGCVHETSLGGVGLSLQTVEDSVKAMARVIQEAQEHEQATILMEIDDARQLLETIAESNIYALDPADLRRRARRAIETLRQIHGKKDN